ncbi:MAG TPA: hypothetical protein VGK67_05230 [Myxococcales bacterium]
MSGFRSKAQVGMALAALLCAACRASPPACPEGFARDEARTAEVVELLRADPEARGLIPDQGLRGVCYAAAGEGQVAPGPVLLLSSKAPERDSAARAAHLLLHEREGLVRAVEAGGCGEAGLARVRAAEERAWALEGRVRRRLGLPERPSELERIMGQYEARCADLARKDAR